MHPCPILHSNRQSTSSLLSLTTVTRTHTSIHTRLQIHMLCVPCDVLPINFITSRNFMSFVAGCCDNRFNISMKAHSTQVLSAYTNINTRILPQVQIFIVQMRELHILIKHTATAGLHYISPPHLGSLCILFLVLYSTSRIDGGCNKSLESVI